MANPISIHARQILPAILPAAVVLTLWWIYMLEKPEYRPVPHYLRSDGYVAGEVSPDCLGVVQGSPGALEQARLLAVDRDYLRTVLLPDEYYINATRDCRNFISTRGYATWALQEEKDFPLAYSIVAHHKVKTFERLLRAIYAPQNVYCIHVDVKAPPSVGAAISNITGCFPNVFLVSRAVSVVYAGWSRVQADLNCMADLLNVSGVPWRYLINLCGQDFPTKTNLEMVRSLRALNGSNSIESIPIPGTKRWRVQSVYAPGPAPFQLPVMAGSAYIIASRGYIHSALTDPRVQELTEWSKDTYSPDEVLWATIQRMPDIPGSTSPDHAQDMGNMETMARLVMWRGEQSSKCHGHFVRGVCVFSVGDLPWIVQHHHLFANKFDVDADSVAVHCLEEYLKGKRLLEAQREGF
ncbi:hypothetical protein CRUP_021420 [Coryphaenoides rupestris]|nr:hypothetical protein CRUP_021420 [Coryphaenoides rupestris]